MSATTDPAGDCFVRQFRQILIWPLQLMPLVKGGPIENHWQALTTPEARELWRELDDEFPENPEHYQERHYREFVAFLPHVQRFLYGERASRSGRTTYGESPIRIFRRLDVKTARLTFHDDPAPLDVEVIHADLYFFYDVDVVIPAIEIATENLSLKRAQDVIYRFGRAYPAGWTHDGEGTNCLERVDWLDADGAILSSSDYQARAKYLGSVCGHQAATISAHWEWLLAPLRLNQSPEPALARYRQLEFHRMPTMAWLAVDDPTAIARPDYMRLAFASAPDAPAHTGRFMYDFENRYCYDRFYDPGRSDSVAHTRMLCSGQAFIAVGEAGKRLFVDAERGFLAQFRHQYFLVGLIANFHRAALLMMSDRLVATVSRLKIEDRESVARFRHDIRKTLETFLRFTHRYYFSEISDQLPLRDVFRLWAGHLGTDRLYAELRDELSDMSSYLETDLLRRQAKTILQLTVTTLLSLIGSMTTGFLGMNLFDLTDLGPVQQIGVFLMVFLSTALLTFYTVRKSRRFADFLDALADQKADWNNRMSLFKKVWRER